MKTQGVVGVIVMEVKDRIEMEKEGSVVRGGKKKKGREEKTREKKKRKKKKKKKKK